MASSRKKPSPDALAGRLADWLRRRLPDSAGAHGQPLRLCVALSGGLDSIVLLDLLQCVVTDFPVHLCAVHVHHGLQAQADEWVAFVREVCAARSIALQIEYARIGEAPSGIEAAARAARYEAFCRQPADVILLAHHRNDQAETVLHHALRGNGLAGLAAMPAERALQPGLQLWRPLLDESRSTLLAWAQQRRLAWVEDPSNTDQRYTRNLLRQRILPELEHHFPATGRALARLAQHAAEANGLLAELARDDLRLAVTEGWLAPQALMHVSSARQRNALRYWLREEGWQADAAVFESLWVSVQSLDYESDLAVSVAGYCVRAYRGRLCVTPAELRSGAPALLDMPQADVCQFAPGWSLGVRWDWRPGGIAPCWLAPGTSLRVRRPGDQLRVRGMRREFKQLCQQAGIPSWLRDCLPVLECDGQLLAIAGVAVDDAVSARELAGWWPEIVPVWLSGKEKPPV
ncbi:tRNA lysidine(34) synthetase TilS [Chitinilyticum piscinae]|uniref:tRNA(Ile)-lysidine synthase n=1 Tax=Chitinilyticum piscinae TaxID=2866724 RepID=A0A8J7FI77_9NEIS|nr:tRNA lysidine(34) synthetase TilS [Chitinilyticum piscinae]MBE9608685.1 tRNA lysidine(34) synthetase TilS [Chitinilyticum piscinae]